VPRKPSLSGARAAKAGPSFDVQAFLTSSVVSTCVEEFARGETIDSSLVSVVLHD
jgi:hypothetical protein